MTKVATAVAVMQLYEEGKLDIDDPVISYLPYFSTGQQPDPLAQVTIRQLLRHTSGLPDMIPALIGWVHYDDEIYNQSKYLQRLMPDYARLRFEPDTKSAYTNFGYLVLGGLIEEVSGQSYEDYIIEHILEPAGMDLTNFLYTPEMRKHEASGSHPLLSMYTPMLPFLLDMKAFASHRQGMVYWLNRMYLDVTPSSGLIGSSHDVARFMLTYMNTELLLTEDSKTAMLPNGNHPDGRPLGWSQYALDERLWLQHRGGGPGFATIMRIYPEESLGVAVMANGTNLPAEKIVETLANRVFRQM
jgi:CubicO group peptidase (beta-lactamase class C family)